MLVSADWGQGIVSLVSGATLAFCCKVQRPTQVISIDEGSRGSAVAMRKARITEERRLSHTAGPCGAWHVALHLTEAHSESRKPFVG